MSMAAKDLDSLILANNVTLASDAFSIPLILLFSGIVYRVAAMQGATQRQYEGVGTD